MYPEKSSKGAGQMTRFDLVGFTAILFIISTGIILYHTDIAEALYSIPPTIAIKSIFVGSDPNNNVTADSYAGNTTFIEGTGITITPDFASNELTFTATGGSAGTLESLTNVTDVGCGTGQVIKVSGANWVCANDDTGAGATTLDQLTDVTLTAPAYRHILQYNQQLAQWINKLFTINSQTAQTDFQIIGINNQTGVITTNQFSVNTEDAGYFNRIKSINNVTGQVTYDTIDFVDTTTCGGTQKVSAINNITGVVTCTDDQEGPIPATTLDGLTDVTITSAGYGDILSYRAGATNQWIDKLFLLSTKACSGTDKISSIDNQTGVVTCTTDSGIATAITSINADTTAAQVLSGTAGNITITSTGAGALKFNTAFDVIMRGGSVQQFTKSLDFGAGTTQKFPTSGTIIRNPAATFGTTLSGSAVTANRTLNLPLITGTDTLGALAMIQSWTGNNTEKFGAGGVIIRNPASTFTTKIEGAPVTANRTLNLPTITQTETLAIRPVTSSATNATVQATASATLVFAGRALTITPVVTGNILVYYTGYVSDGTLLDGCTLSMREGTGAFPRAGAAVSGTAVGINIIATSATANANVPFAIVYPLTGLTVGTSAWFEPVFSNAIGGTCSLRSTMLVLFEY